MKSHPKIKIASGEAQIQIKLTPRLGLKKVAVQFNLLGKSPGDEEAMAQIYTLLGDADHAIPILKRLLQIPYGGGRIPYAGAITPALLRINPIWDPIRNDPRFQELAADKTP